MISTFGNRIPGYNLTDLYQDSYSLCSCLNRMKQEMKLRAR